MEINDSWQVTGFEEKPDQPRTIPGEDDLCLASMGIYVFSSRFLYEQLLKDANSKSSSRDFGKNIIPSVIDTHKVVAFPFADKNNKKQAYWRDVGTIDSYYDANMDLVTVEPQLNMYDDVWPIRTDTGNYPPPKFVFGGDDIGRVGMATDSIVCPGSIISGGHVERSVIGPRVRVNSFANVQDSILFEEVQVGRYSQIRRAIVDKGVIIPSGIQIGFDPEEDRRRGLLVSDSGIVVIGKGMPVARLSTDQSPGSKNVPSPHMRSSRVQARH